MIVSVRQKNFIFVLLIPLLLAVATRAVLLTSWWHSPFRYYSYVSGLDMQTVLLVGSWLYQGFSVFTLYKFTTAMIMWLNHGSHCPEALIVMQMLMGTGISLTVSWIALHLTGKRVWAMTSGLLAALYAPALMYECFVLIETYLVFFSLLALAAVVWGRKRHFSPSACFITGVMVALPSLCRITALPFIATGGGWLLLHCLRRRRGHWRKSWRDLSLRVLCFGAGVLLLLAPVSVFNYFNTDGQTFLPFHVNIDYAVSLGKIENPKSMNPEVEAPVESPGDFVAPAELRRQRIGKVVGFTANLFRKMPLVFLPYEIPNNLNYYFVRSKLRPLEYLPGPLLLLPLAVTALLLILFTGRFLRRESLLLFYIIAFIFPICFFFPLARYRLVLFPVFCLLAPYPVFFAVRSIKEKTLFKSLIPLLVYAPVLLLSMPDINLRNEDFIAYGKALEKQDGNPQRAINYYRAAYQRAPHYQAAIINYIDALLHTGQPERAAMVADAALAETPEHPAYLFYAALTAFFSRNPERAAFLFQKLSPSALAPGSRVAYHYYFGESLRLQHKFDAAAIEYRKGLAANPTKIQEDSLLAALAGIPSPPENAP